MRQYTGSIGTTRHNHIRTQRLVFLTAPYCLRMVILYQRQHKLSLSDTNLGLDFPTIDSYDRTLLVTLQ